MAPRSRDDDLLKKLQNILVHSRHGRRSPHKPLLLLLSIGRHLNGHERLATFGDLEQELNPLIGIFGPPFSKGNTHDPFWRLQSDGLWEIDHPELVTPIEAGGPRVPKQHKHNVRGGLSPEFVAALDKNADFLGNAVRSLLNGFFQPSIHNDVMTSVGIAFEPGPALLTGARSAQDGRDRSFRAVVLNAYKNRCALCKLDVNFGDQPVGLEAAHIKWHAAKGPAKVENGLCLCVLHHKFFDLGLFTVSPDLAIRVAKSVAGQSSHETLNKYDGSALPVIPDCPDERPASEYLKWHARVGVQGPTCGRNREPAIMMVSNPLIYAN